MTSITLNEVTLARGVEAFRAGRLDDAQQYFLKVLEFEEGNPDALYFMALIDQQAGRLEAAEYRAGELVRLKPEDGKALNLLGTLQMSLAKLQQASETFARGIRADTSNAIVRVNAAICQMGLVSPDNAIELCREALLIRPDYANAYNIMGTAYLAKGEPEKAAASFRKSVEIQPDFADAYFNLGKALFDMCSFDEALKCFNGILGKDPAHAHALTRRADILVIRGQYQAAAADYNSAIRANPGFAPAYIGIGKVFQAMDQHEQALGYFKKAIELDSVNVEALMLAGDSFRNLGRFDAAAAAFRDVLDIDPENFQASFHLAAIGERMAPPRPDSSYVRSLFDEFADRFDNALAKVEYDAPQQLRELAELYMDPKMAGTLDILDLGCGTGLSGACFRNLAGRIKGVDLSPRMIERARARNIYDELEISELLESLVRRQNDTDLAVCSDIFPYIGDLEAAFLAVSSALRDNGLFLFCVETHQDDADYRLNDTARYSHSEKYIRELSARRGFDVLACNSSVYRKEAGRPVDSLMVALRKTVRC